MFQIVYFVNKLSVFVLNKQFFLFVRNQLFSDRYLYNCVVENKIIIFSLYTVHT